MLRFIRKFGLERCDLSTMLWNVSFLLRALSLNVDDKNTGGIPVIFYLFTVISAGCYFYVYLVSMAWFVWRCSETGDVPAAMLVFSLGIASEIGPVKLIYVMFHAKQMRKIASTSLDCDALVVPGSHFSKNMLKALRNVKIRAIIFWIMMMGNGAVYLARPFLTPGRHLMEDIFMYYGLEPMLESPNYEIAMTVTIIGGLFACYSVVNVTAFVIINVGYVEAQMLAWSEELLVLWDNVEKFITKDIFVTNVVEVRCDFTNDEGHKKAINEQIRSRLCEVIRGHSRNLHLLHQIENVFTGAFALEFLILIVALIAELLGGLEKTYIEVPFSFIPVVVDCLTGQRLSDASQRFERAVFGCKWENFDTSNKKLVLVMLQSSQKTMKLSAGGLAILNFSFLMSVVRNVFSAYTTLRSYTTAS